MSFLPTSFRSTARMGGGYSDFRAGRSDWRGTLGAVFARRLGASVALSVDGFTRDSAGVIVPGCNVVLYSVADEAVLAVGGSNALGYYRFDNFGPGPFHVDAYKNGAPVSTGTTSNSIYADQVLPASTYNLNFATAFALTENPLRDGTRWREGKADGIDWNNIQTNGARAFGTADSPTGVDDNIACLNPAVFTFNDNQFIQGTVFIAAGYAPATNHEIELHIGTVIGANSITTMEFLINMAGTSAMARWDGAINNVQFPIPTGPGTTIVTSGDVFLFERTGNVYTVKQNGTLIYALTDATRVGGTPGIATFSRPSVSIVQSSFGWSAISAGNL